MERWREEIILCETDLDCSRRWFKSKEDFWENLKDEAMLDGLEGHSCYASKQVATWKAMGDAVQNAIEGLDKSVLTTLLEKE